MTVAPEPFIIAVPEAVLHDVPQRLALTRWPDETPKLVLALLSNTPSAVAPGAWRVHYGTDGGGGVPA